MGNSGGGLICQESTDKPLLGTRGRDHPKVTYLVQGWHCSRAPLGEKVPGGQSSHTVSCH